MIAKMFKIPCKMVLTNVDFYCTQSSKIAWETKYPINIGAKNSCPHCNPQAGGTRSCFKTRWTVPFPVSCACPTNPYLSKL